MYSDKRLEGFTSGLTMKYRNILHLNYFR